MLGWMLLCCYRRDRLKRQLVIVLGFLPTFIPLLIFHARNPEALLARFKEVSYLYDTNMGATEKFWFFVESYLE
jgi:hypothetical protein